MGASPSAPLSSDIRWRLVLMRPEGSASSKRSMVPEPGDAGSGVDAVLSLCPYGVLSPRYAACCAWKLCCRDSEFGWGAWWWWWGGGKSFVVGLEFGLLIECMVCSEGLFMFMERGGGKREEDMGGDVT